MLSLSLARAFYLVLGVGLILLTVGNLNGMLGAGAVFYPGTIIGGFALGALLLAAAAFVESRRPVQAAMTWVALVVVTALCVWAVAATYVSGRDPIQYAVGPAAVVLLATARLAVARRRAGTLGAIAVGS